MSETPPPPVVMASLRVIPFVAESVTLPPESVSGLFIVIVAAVTAKLFFAAKVTGRLKVTLPV